MIRESFSWVLAWCSDAMKVDGFSAHHGLRQLSLVLLSMTACFAQSAAPQNRAAQRALEEVEPLLQKDPGNPRLLAIRGVALYSLGQVDEALHSAEKALAISPKYLAALELAADITFGQQNAASKGYLDRILMVEPANAPAHAMLAALAFAKPDCAAASDHFAAAKAEIQSNPMALAQWGECLISLNQVRSGVAHLHESLAIRNDAKVRYNLALALYLIVFLHVAAALKHHFVSKDDVLRRMLPFRKDRDR